MKEINVKKTAIFTLEAIFAWMLVSGACMFLSIVFQKEYSFIGTVLIWAVLVIAGMACDKFDTVIRAYYKWSLNTYKRVWKKMTEKCGDIRNDASFKFMLQYVASWFISYSASYLILLNLFGTEAEILSESWYSWVVVGIFSMIFNYPNESGKKTAGCISHKKKKHGFWMTTVLSFEMLLISQLVYLMVA